MTLKHWKPETVKRLVRDMREEVGLTAWVRLTPRSQRALVAERTLIGIMAQDDTPSKEACWELLRAMNQEARQQLPWSTERPLGFWARCWSVVTGRSRGRVPPLLP